MLILIKSTLKSCDYRGGKTLFFSLLSWVLQLDPENYTDKIKSIQILFVQPTYTWEKLSEG